MSQALSPDRLRRIAEVLEACLELDETLRAQYVAVLARDDLDLARRVFELLDAHAEVTVQAVPERPSPDAASQEDASGEVRQIGPYRVVEWLGMGGMGTVYLAERSDEEFERRVAIKVIRLGLDVPEIRRRFLSERQILATFDHPNIAQMYEGGTTSEGLPYLVMEYVEGVPIDRYCDEHRLTVKQRLELFRQVCSAVEYSHRNLVVHRDLKPSNVLVSADGTPKLLDFGIAKLLDPEHFPLTVEATQTGHGPLTPNYASPEQIAAERVTTLSDVYSLGVLLYKLLTGRLPFDRQARSRELMAQEAALEAPTRPSLIVGTTVTKGQDKDTASDSSLWSAERGQHRRLLRGDIDNIVLKALRGAADRRYGSVQLLDDDIGRHLQGLPVRARQASLAYRTGLFVRRNKLAVAATSAFMALAVGFLAFTLQKNVEILAARDRALVQEKRAESVAEFFVDLFSELSPERARGREVTSTEILEKASDRLLGDRSGDPSVRVSLLTSLSGMLLVFGDLPRADKLSELAYAEGQAVGGKSLGMAAVVRALNRANESTEEAFQLLEEALPAFTNAGARADIGRTYAQMAMWAPSRPEAIRLAELSISIGEELGDPDVARNGYNNLALVKGVDDLAGSVVAMEKAVSLVSGIYPEEHPKWISSTANLALYYQELGRLDEVGALHPKIVAASTTVYGPAAPLVAIDHNNYAMYFMYRGEYVQEEEQARRALAIWDQQFGLYYPSSWYALSHLCKSLTYQSRPAYALEFCLRSLETNERQGWPGLSARVALARTLRFLGRFAEADQALEEATTIYEDESRRDRFRRYFLPEAKLEESFLARAAGDEQRATEALRAVIDATAESLAKNRGIQITVSWILAHLRLGLHDEVREQVVFLTEAGYKGREFELYCLEYGSPPVCESLEPLFPEERWTGGVASWDPSEPVTGRPRNSGESTN